MIRFTWIGFVVVLIGCSGGKTAAPLESSPELVQLFGSGHNLRTVQHAYSSSQLGMISPSSPPPPGPVMYIDGRVARLSEILGRSTSYAWSTPVHGDFTPDIKVEFVGEAHFDPNAPAEHKPPVLVLIDRTHQLLEVRVGDVVQERASFSPAASHLDEYFTSIGLGPVVQ